MHNTVIVRKATLKTLFKRGDGLDMRTRQARRLRTIVLGYIDALGHEPSINERALIMSCARQRCSLEQIEQQSFDRGEPLPAEYREQADLLTRQMAQLGVLRTFGARQHRTHNVSELGPHNAPHNVSEHADA